jgi:hypothetical protein
VRVDVVGPSESKRASIVAYARTLWDGGLKNPCFHPAQGHAREEGLASPAE